MGTNDKNVDDVFVGADGKTKPVKGKSPKSLGKFFGILALVVIVLATAFSSFYIVKENEQVVLTMFGKVVDVKSAGAYFKIPFVQNVTHVDTTTKGLQIGYRTSDEEDGDGMTTIPEESTMITSDFNFVDVDFYLEYRVSDPVTYLYASDETEAILKNMAQACIRTVVSNYPVDEVITTGKSQIQADIRDMLNKKLSKNNIGFQVVNLTIQDAEPPTSEIVAAFKSVETAKQGKETAINNARKYENEKIPAAAAQADKIVQEAEATKASRIAEAQGQVARFNEMYAEYVKNPLITKQRIFYETMEDVLPTVKLYITDEGTQKMLPLESFSLPSTTVNDGQDDANKTETKANDETEESEEE